MENNLDRGGDVERSRSPPVVIGTEPVRGRSRSSDRPPCRLISPRRSIADWQEYAELRAPNNRGRGNHQVPVVYWAAPRSKCGRGRGSPCPSGPGRRERASPSRALQQRVRATERDRDHRHARTGHRCVRSDLRSSLLDLTLELWTIERGRTNVAFLRRFWPRGCSLAAWAARCPGRPPCSAAETRQGDAARYMVRGSGCGGGRKSAARLWAGASGRVEAQRACVGRHEMDQDGTG